MSANHVFWAWIFVAWSSSSRADAILIRPDNISERNATSPATNLFVTNCFHYHRWNRHNISTIFLTTLFTILTKCKLQNVLLGIRNIIKVTVASRYRSKEVSNKHIFGSFWASLIAVVNLDIDKWLLRPLIRDLVKNVWTSWTVNDQVLALVGNGHNYNNTHKNSD